MNAQAKPQNEKRCNYDRIKVGDRISETQYYEVIRKDPSRIQVKNVRGFTFSIGKSIVEEGMFTADQHDEVIKVNRTEMCEVLEAAGDSIFTVCFEKQMKPKDLTAALIEKISSTTGIKKNKTATNKFAKDFFKESFGGEERVLVGHLVRTEPKMGRSHAYDLEKGGLRLIDHRTLRWLILRGKKYILK